MTTFLDINRDTNNEWEPSKVFSLAKDASQSSSNIQAYVAFVEEMLYFSKNATCFISSSANEKFCETFENLDSTLVSQTINFITCNAMHLFSSFLVCNVSTWSRLPVSSLRCDIFQILSENGQEKYRPMGS